MTIIYSGKQDVQTRVRRRRRKINIKQNAKRSVKTRRLMVIVSICLITMFGGYFGVNGDRVFDSRAFAAEQTVYKTVTVYSGDTIWGIANEYTEPSKDIRKQVKAICELNDVTPGNIYPGQILLVPVPAHLA